jgi:hypothetical protein
MGRRAVQSVTPMSPVTINKFVFGAILSAMHGAREGPDG